MVERYIRCTVRYLPLGSPWSISNRLFSGHLLRSGHCGVGRGGGGVVRVGTAGWVLGGCYTGTHPPSHPSGLHWYCQGPTHARYAFLRPLGHSRGPADPLRTPELPALRYASWSQYGRDSAPNILKLVNNLECRRKSSMRPVILPISKTGPEYTTLNFQISHNRQPSLTRNKWSPF